MCLHLDSAFILVTAIVRSQFFNLLLVLVLIKLLGQFDASLLSVMKFTRPFPEFVFDGRREQAFTNRSMAGLSKADDMGSIARIDVRDTSGIGSVGITGIGTGGISEYVSLAC